MSREREDGRGRPTDTPGRKERALRRPAHVSGDVSTANGPDNGATTDGIERGDASGSLVVNTGEMTRKRAETKTRNYYKLPFIHRSDE